VALRSVWPGNPGLVLSPSMIRNLALFGEPVWTTTHGGYTLALANNPVYYRNVLDGEPWPGLDRSRLVPRRSDFDRLTSVSA